MEFGRRNFFKALAAAPAATLASVPEAPEPDSIGRVSARTDAAYVLSYDGRLSAEDVDNIKADWLRAFEGQGLAAPLLLVFDSGMKLERLGAEKAPVVNVQVSGVMDPNTIGKLSRSLTEHIRRLAPMGSV